MLNDMICTIKFWNLDFPTLGVDKSSLSLCKSTLRMMVVAQMFSSWSHNVKLYWFWWSGKRRRWEKSGINWEPSCRMLNDMVYIIDFWNLDFLILRVALNESSPSPEVMVVVQIFSSLLISYVLPQESMRTSLDTILPGLRQGVSSFLKPQTIRVLNGQKHYGRYWRPHKNEQGGGRKTCGHNSRGRGGSLR